MLALVSEDWNFFYPLYAFLERNRRVGISNRSGLSQFEVHASKTYGPSFRHARQLRRQHFHRREEPNSHSRLDGTSEASLAFLGNRTFRSATTGKSSRGAFGFPHQSTWPAPGPSQRPRGAVRIFTNTQARGVFALFWSLVFGPGNAFLVPEVNDLAFGGLVI